MLVDPGTTASHRHPGRDDKTPTADVGEVVAVARDELLTPDEAARRLKVTAEQIRALIRAGRLAAINVGTGAKRPLYRISIHALDDFLSSRHQPARANRPPRFKPLPPVEDHFPHLR